MSIAALHPRAPLRPAPALAVVGLLVVLLAGCGDPPTTEAEGSGDRPAECGEPSSLELAIDGAPVEFVASSSVANHVDDQTWLVAVGDVDVELGSAETLSELPPGPSQGTRVTIRLHSADGPIRSEQTLTAADLGVGLSISRDGVEIPVSSLGAQATVAYVDDSNICGSLAVTDDATSANAGSDAPTVTVGGTFVASTG